MKKLSTVHPPPTPSPRSVATLPRKDCGPQNVLAHYATDAYVQANR